LTVRMLDRGFLAGGAFYPTLAHEERHVDAYLAAAGPVFAELADALRPGDARDRLGSPVKQSGFARLTEPRTGPPAPVRARPPPCPPAHISSPEGEPTRGVRDYAGPAISSPLFAAGTRSDSSRSSSRGRGRAGSATSTSSAAAAMKPRDVQKLTWKPSSLS